MEKRLQLIALFRKDENLRDLSRLLLNARIESDAIRYPISLHEALRMLKASETDALLLDAGEQGKNLKGIIDTIHAEQANIPVIVFARTADGLTRKMMPEIGAHDLLVYEDCNSQLLEKTVLLACHTNQLLDAETQFNYHFLVDKNPLPALIVEASSGRITFVNSRATDFYGYSHNEFLKLTIHQLGGYLTSCNCHLTAESPGPEIFRHKRKDGTIVDVEISRESVVANGHTLQIVVIHDVTAYNCSMQLLRENEERLNLAIQAGRMAILDIDFKTGAFSFSKGVACIGADIEHLQNLENALANVHPSDLVKVQYAITLARQGKNGDVQFRLIRPDNGATVWLERRSYIVHDEHGKPIESRGLLIDITDLKSTQDYLLQSFYELEAAANRQVAILNAIPASIALLDHDGNIIQVNNTWLNHDAENNFLNGNLRVGENYFTDQSDDASPVFQGIKDVIDGLRLQFQSEYSRQSSTGRNWFKITVTRFSTADKAGAVIMHVNISDRKKIENKLRASDEQYQILSKATNDAVWDWDILNDTVQWNLGLKYIFGFEPHPEQNAGRWWRDNIHPADLERVTNDLLATFKSGATHWDSTYRFRCADDTYKHCHDRGYVVYKNGEAVRMTGAFQDVNELTEYRISLEQKVNERTEELCKAMEKEKELAELKSRFVSIASHEFRTPLSTIQFAADYLHLHRKKISEQEIESKLSGIHVQIERMMGLLDDVLTVGSSDAGKIRVNKTNVEVKSFFSNLIANVKCAHKSLHQIKTSFGIDSEVIETDEKLLHNIFTNLLSNAVKFSPDNTEVHLKCFHESRDLVIEVADQGIGIDSSDMNTIFEPFQRGSNVGAISGTGLGLTIVKTAVTLLQGVISIYRTDQYNTVFRVVLPGAHQTILSNRHNANQR